MDIQKKTIKLYSHIGRLKYWKKGSRDPLSCTKRGATSGNNLQKTSSEEGEARNPSPDLEARQDFWSIVVGYIVRNHVAPRTKLHVPKDDFPIHLKFFDVRCSTKIHQKDVCWFQGRLTKKQVTTRPGHIWLEEWSSMSKNPQRKASNKLAE